MPRAAARLAGQTCGLLLCSWQLLAAAQGLPPVADPATPVPVQPYRSSLPAAPGPVDSQRTEWRAANAVVAQFPRGHADLLAWEERQAASNGTADAPAPVPAQPGPAPTPDSGSPHAQHRH